MIDNSETATAAAARRAFSEDNLDKALELWKLATSASPAAAEGYLGQAEVFRALKRIDRADEILRAYPPHAEMLPEMAVSYALNAQIAENWPEALLRWRAAREAFGQVPVMWAGEAAILQVLGELEEAESLTTQAVLHFPDSLDVHAQHCNVAEARGDWLALDCRWAELEERFATAAFTSSQRAGVRARIATGLKGLGTDELLGLAANAALVLPPPQSLAAWREIYRRDPETRESGVGLVLALKKMRQYAEAERILCALIKTRPDDLELRAHHAELAGAQADWLEAARRWQKVLQQFPDQSVVWSMAATAYREAGMLALADELIEKAIQLEPERIELHVHYALTAERGGSWTEAIVRWNRALDLRPDDLNIQNSRGNAIWQETIARLESGGPAHPAAAAVDATADAGEAAALKALAMSFEGLGDSCEFGTVQRRLGADPIGLLRFAAVTAPTLTSMIKDRFVRLGDPAFTELFLNPHDEYFVRDTRHLYHMHSFVHKDSVDAAKFLKQQITRLGFLKRKLLEDFESREKIFVYNASLPVTDHQILALHDALAEFGPNHLLVVRRAEDAAQLGTHAVIRDRLVVAFAGMAGARDTNPDLEIWKRILTAVVAYRNAPPRH